jgi:precorrin-2/cobalt-factor-2 C20-methyltransferase
LSGIFYGIGVGPGEPELLTLKAVNILQKIDVLAIPESKKEKGSVAYEIVKPYLKKEIEILVLTFPMINDNDKKAKFREENALKIKKKIDEGKLTAFLTLGDPMIYSTYIYLLENLRGLGVKFETVPGITSFSAIASRIGYPIVKGDEKFGVISSFDKDTEIIAGLFDTLIFMKVSAYKNEFLDLLKKLKRKFVLISNVGKANERIIVSIEDFEKEDITYFSTVILYKEV